MHGVGHSHERGKGRWQRELETILLERERREREAQDNRLLALRALQARESERGRLGYSGVTVQG